MNTIVESSNFPSKGISSIVARHYEQAPQKIIIDPNEFPKKIENKLKLSRDHITEIWRGR